MRISSRTRRRDPSTTASQLASAIAGAIAGLAAGVVLAQLLGGASGIASRVGRRRPSALGPEPGYDADWEEPEDEVEPDEIEPADELLGRRVLEAFVNDPLLSERAIDIDVAPDATIALTGAVDDEHEATYAETVARGVPGVKQVVTEFEVARR